jgi:hypothetical protein
MPDLIEIRILVSGIKYADRYLSFLHLHYAVKYAFCASNAQYSEFINKIVRNSHSFQY